MKKSILLALLIMLILISGSASAQSPEPTQTPYIVYIVVTATPEPTVEDEIRIQRPSEVENNNQVTILNQTTSSNTYAETTDELVQRVVATVMAQANTTAGGTATTGTSNTSAASGTAVHLSDGTTCSASFQLVSEPSYPAGSIIPRGEVFWKEWEILNTGTCTWTPEWSFVFDSGWQIGNTRFAMNRTTAPGNTLTVRLAMVPDQKWNGNYYSTYAFEAPDGTRIGTITSSYTVKDPSYFAPTPTVPPMRPRHGEPVWPPRPCRGPDCPPLPPCPDPRLCPPPEKPEN